MQNATPRFIQQTGTAETQAREAALVAAMLTGSNQAWDTFHKSYVRLAFRCITKVVGRFSTSMSEDDIEEIYAILLSQLVVNDMARLRSFCPERGNRFGTWVGRLAINATYDYLRARRRASSWVSLDEASELPCCGSSPLDVAEAREGVEMVGDVVRELSQKDQRFVALYFGEDLEPEEIALQLQIHVKTVYSKKHKIQARIGQMLSQAQLAA